jgi:hypothetical protein
MHLQDDIDGHAGSRQPRREEGLTVREHMIVKL